MANSTLEEVTTRVADAAKGGLKAVKQRAQRRDRVGVTTHRALELVSDGLGATAKALGQLGDAIEPARRGSPNAPAVKATPKPKRPTRRPAAKTS